MPQLLSTLRLFGRYDLMKFALVRAVENLWEKYAVSRRALEAARAEAMHTLDSFLEGLRYV